MDIYKIEKGEEGEEKVYKIVNTILKEMNFKYQIIRNAILPFESVYGKKGYITAEFDIVVFTPFYIFLIEIKNEHYLEYDYNEPLWKLINDEMVSNPLNQNHTHKMVFCSELNVPRESVITIEILLENGKIADKKSPYINDYILDNNEMHQKLKYLFATENNQEININSICELFSKKVKDSKLNVEEHIAILKRTEKIETRIKRTIGYINLRRTDIVTCKKCGTGKLFFRESNYKSRFNSKRKSMHYGLGCSNYGSNENNCEGLIYVDAYKDFSEFARLEPLSIEQRNNWEKEKMVRTVLDEIENLKKENKNLLEENNMIRIEKNEIKRRFQECEAKIIQQREDIKTITAKENKTAKELDTIREIVSRYRKIVGNLYYLKK